MCRYNASSISYKIFHDYTKGPKRSEDKRRVIVDVSENTRHNLEKFIRNLEPGEGKLLFFEQIKHVNEQGEWRNWGRTPIEWELGESTITFDFFASAQCKR